MFEITGIIVWALIAAAVGGFTLFFLFSIGRAIVLGIDCTFWHYTESRKVDPTFKYTRPLPVVLFYASIEMFSYSESNTRITLISGAVYKPFSRFFSK